MKYIIEFEDEPTAYEDGMTFYACKQIPYWCMSKGHLNRLTPYTEPDLNPLVDEAVETIENEVWEFVRIITDMTECERKECFGGSTCDLDEYVTYQEAKAKYEAWKKKKEEIRVGDEVKFLSLAKSGVVVSEDDTPNVVGDKAFNVVWEDGSTGYHYKKDLFRTGRHFDEVEELMKKMRDTE